MESLIHSRRDRKDGGEAPSAEESIRREVERQRHIHPDGFPATRDGVRLGLASIEDETREALLAWDTGKRDDFWNDTEYEVLQIVGNAIRLYESLRQYRDKSPRDRSKRVGDGPWGTWKDER